MEDLFGNFSDETRGLVEPPHLTTEAHLSENSGSDIVYSLLAGGIFFARGILLHKRLRKVVDTPRSRIATAAQGLVEIQGFAWPLDKCVKTVSGVEAVYYEFKLEKKVSSGKNSRWVVVSKFQFFPNFLIVDATGAVEIDPSDAETELVERRIRSWAALSPPEQEYAFEHFVTEQVSGLSIGGAGGNFFGPQYRIVEKYVRRGSPIYVSGEFKTRHMDPQSVRSTGLTRFGEMVFNYEARSEKNVSNQLDRNRDGHISFEESLDGYAMAAALACRRTETEGLTERDFEIFGLLENSTNHRLFFAPAKQETLLQKLKMRPALYFLAGCALLTYGVSASWSRLPKAATQQIAMSSSSPERARSIQVLHQMCVDNVVSACVEILDQKKVYQISEQQLKFYAARACALGEKKFCP